MALVQSPDPQHPEVSVGSVRYSTAQDQAYDYLKQRILSGEFPGGMRLNPTEVATLLGVSRTPVREALHRLDIEGLVTLTPNRGVVVTALTLELVRELFKIRGALEALAASEAARNIREDDLDEFELLIRRMDRSRGDPKAWIIRHDAFHDRLYEFAQMPRLTAEIRRLREAIHPHLRLYIDVYHHTEMPGYEHRTMLAEIGSGSAERASRAMLEHVESAALGVLEFLATRPSPSPPPKD
jgi:DNA-binding GntR family transcriptional regulator